MGEGKTEAGIYAATKMGENHNKHGMYIALPTAATSNQMYTRITKLLDTHGIKKTRLLHSMAWIVDSATPDTTINSEDGDVAYRWLSPLRRGLLSPYAVGTVDQTMMAALKVKYGVLRLLGLANKVLVIDEIHAYDAYMNQIIIRLLQWCRALHIPVVLLSATLPKQKKKELVCAYGGDTVNNNAYPLITTVDIQGHVEEHAVNDTYINKSIAIRLEPLLSKWSDVAQQAMDKVCDGGCLCVMANTVNDAQEIYQNLKKTVKEDFKLLLFHSRFIAVKRNKIENRQRRCVSFSRR